MSLIEKLGIKKGFKIFIVNPPRAYSDMLKELSEDVYILDMLKGPLDFIHLFVSTKEELNSKLPSLKNELSVNGALWISWPKRKSGIVTDLNENIVREIGLSNGLVDVKVIAVDENWSALKFVYRLKDRAIKNERKDRKNEFMGRLD
ncbi:MAG: DUF3052 domain-containing protein [Actinobacteria bacterium]|nr:DUF3052 domain-containing protein [Actinomycetota bacterium]